MNTVTQETIKEFESLGWKFVSHSWRKEKTSDIEYSWGFRSPRMNFDGFVPDGFDKVKLLQEESKIYVTQCYGSMISIGLAKAQHDLINQLAALQRLKDNGKPVEFPAEITVKEVKIAIGHDPALKLSTDFA